MSAANNNELRMILQGKTVEELEAILAVDFAKDSGIDTDFVRLVLEVIEEKEQSCGNLDSCTWPEIQERYKAMQSENLLKADLSLNTSPEHRCNTSFRHPKRQFSHHIRRIAIAAIITLLLCGTAFGLNLWQLIVNWTTDTFSFLSSNEVKEVFSTEAMDHLRVSVARITDIPVVPYHAPPNTQQIGNLSITERNDRYIVGAGYITEGREFSILIVVFRDTVYGCPSYQKNPDIEKEYISGNVTHYLSGNMDNQCAIWINENIECSIQGQLTEQELQQMIDSIYLKE